MDRSRNRRDEIFWAVCIPNSCGGTDVVDAMSDVLKMTNDPYGMDISVDIRPNMCQVENEQGPFDWIGIPHLVVG